MSDFHPRRDSPRPPSWRTYLALLLVAVSAALVWIAAHAHRAEARLHRGYATSYCLNGRTASGHWVDRRTAAHNWLLPGTRIRLVGPQAGPGGIRRYVVRDTGPALADGHFDLWAPSCSTSVRFGARPIRWKIGWAR